jgi:hypothetical protein
MNITKTVINRIEARRETNKSPCKSYATEAAAEAVAQKKAVEYADHFVKQGCTNAPCRYIVAYNEAWGRWIIAFDISGLANRNTSTGGYLGIASSDGFFGF